MVIEKLTQLVAEDKRQEFGELLGTHVQETVASATETLRLAKEAAEESVGKLETNRDKLLGEYKPWEDLIRSRNIEGENPWDQVGELLDGKRDAPKADPKEIQDLQRKAALAEQATDTAKESLKTAITAQETAEGLASQHLAARDDAALDMALWAATTGNDDDGNPKPRIIAPLYKYAKDHFSQFFEFEDVPDLANGGTVRKMVARHAGVPIVGRGGAPNANMGDLVAYAVEGKGDKPWTTPDGREFFVSTGTGRSSHQHTPGQSPEGGAVTPAMLKAAAASSLSEYEKLRDTL